MSCLCRTETCQQMILLSAITTSTKESCQQRWTREHAQPRISIRSLQCIDVNAKHCQRHLVQTMLYVNIHLMKLQVLSQEHVLTPKLTEATLLS